MTRRVFESQRIRFRLGARVARLLLVLVFLCVKPQLAAADGWEYSISPYLWLPTLTVDSTDVGDGGDPGDGPELEIGPIDYLDALDFALMVSGEARNENWAILADLVYIDFSIDNKDIEIRPPGSEPLLGTYNASLSGSVFTLAGGKTISRDDRSRLDAVVGWRRFFMELGVSGVSNNDEPLDVSDDLEFNDAFVGINGRYDVGQSDGWTMRYYADIGAGQSDLTWQALLGFEYAYGWGDLFVDYRHLDYDFGDSDEFEAVTAVFSGPALGVTFNFGGSN